MQSYCFGRRKVAAAMGRGFIPRDRHYPDVRQVTSLQQHTAASGMFHGSSSDRQSSKSKRRLAKSIRPWIRLSRPGFHLVGLLPFVLGSMLAAFYGYPVSFPVVVLGALGVFLIMLVTYYIGEYFDYEGDCLNEDFNAFSGGSRVLQAGVVSRRTPLLVAIGLLPAVVTIGFVLQFVFYCGPLTIYLGLLGLCAGIFYSAKPVQWAYHGLGELVIGLCYGWLTVNSGYYLQTGIFSPIGTVMSLPIATSIMAVIIANEFPDADADRRVGKTSLVVLLGREVAALTFRILLYLTLAFSFLSAVCAFSFPYFFLPLILVPAVIVISLESLELPKGKPADVERICSNAVIFNLLVTMIPFASLIYEILKRTIFGF